MSEHSGVTGKTPWQAARAERAGARKETRAGRTAAEQLALLNQRPGGARRERARLASHG